MVHVAHIQVRVNVNAKLEPGGFPFRFLLFLGLVVPSASSSLPSASSFSSSSFASDMRVCINTNISHRSWNLFHLTWLVVGPLPCCFLWSLLFGLSHVLPPFAGRLGIAPQWCWPASHPSLASLSGLQVVWIQLCCQWLGVFGVSPWCLWSFFGNRNGR